MDMKQSSFSLLTPVVSMIQEMRQEAATDIMTESVYSTKASIHTDIPSEPTCAVTVYQFRQLLHF